MILALLLQVATFQNYVEEARVKLGLPEPIVVETFSKPVHTHDSAFKNQPIPVFAYVPHKPRNRVRVWDTALGQASKDAQKVVAYHEACHHYLQLAELDAKTPFQLDLVHALQRQCTVETLGREFQRILLKLHNGTYGSRLGTIRWWRNRCR